MFAERLFSGDLRGWRRVCLWFGQVPSKKAHVTQESIAHTIGGQSLLNSLMNLSIRGFGPPGFKDCHLFIISATWLKVAERCSKVCSGSMLVGVTYIDNLDSHQICTSFSRTSNIQSVVMQALLRMEDVSRLSRFGTQVINTRELIWGTGTAQYLSEQCLVRSSKQFLARQVQGEFGQQESGIINLKEERMPSFFLPFRQQLRWSTTSLLR